MELFLNYPLRGQVEQAIGLLAERVIFESPVTGIVHGRRQLEQLMRDRQAMVRRLGASATPPRHFTWSQPDGDGDQIRIFGTTPAPGMIEVRLAFDTEDRVSRVTWRGSPELLVSYYLQGASIGTTPQ